MNSRNYHHGKYYWGFVININIYLCNNLIEYVMVIPIISEA